MKSLAELEAIRQRTLEKVAMRKEGEDAVRVVVGMATCGIAAGARPVMLKFLEEIQKRNLQNVTDMQDMYTILLNSMIIWEEKKTNGYTITYKRFSIYIKIHRFSFLNTTSINLNTRNIRNTI